MQLSDKLTEVLTHAELSNQATARLEFGTACAHLTHAVTGLTEICTLLASDISGLCKKTSQLSAECAKLTQNS